MKNRKRNIFLAPTHLLIH